MEDLNRAISLYDEDKKEEALNAFLEIFEKSHDVNVARHIAKLYKTVGEVESSLFFYQKSLEIEPDDWVGLNNVGLLYEELGQDERALQYYANSLKVQKSYEAYYNLGVVLRKLHDFDKSIKSLKNALLFNPNDTNANYSLAMSYFIKKDFKNGYPYFLKRNKLHPKIQNEWKGSAFTNNSTIMVYSDGGFDDIIMYARYLPVLASKFKEVYFVSPIILRNIFDIENVKFATGADMPDYGVSLLDLPYYLNLDFNHIPPCDNILKIKKSDNAHDKLKVGLCWRGNTAKTRVLKNRSIELLNLKNLLACDFDFYALQKDVQFNELSNFPQIKNLGINFETFEDSANAIKDMDAIVTVDTSMLHLAGTMGIKTCLILPQSSDWRWFSDDKKTPWYDSVTIFKQGENKNLDDISNEIIKMLAI